MSSLKNLKKTIGGFVVMSEEMEKMYTSFLNNRVRTCSRLIFCCGHWTEPELG